MKNVRPHIVLALTLLFVLQSLLLSYVLITPIETADAASFALCAILVMVSIVVDAFAGVHLTRVLRNADTAYAADVAEHLEHSLEEYHATSLRDQASLRAVAMLVERDLTQSRAALERHDIQSLSKHLNRGLNEATRAHVPLCENMVVSAVLESKKQQCAKAGVTLETNVTLPEEIPLNYIDLAAIYFNLIDNSIHECEVIAATTSEPPCITVNSSIQAGQLFVEVINPCRSGAKRRRAEASNSQTLFHGLGTGIVADLACNNGGITEFAEHNGEFAARVMIPLTHEAQ